MANINITKFVNINIAHHASSSISALRDTAVLFSSVEGDDVEYTSQTYNESSISDTNEKDYLNVFFNCGGNKIKVYRGITLENVQSKLANLPYEQIVVGFVGSIFTYEVLTGQNGIVNNYSLSGIYTKLFLVRTTSATDTSVIENLIVKYSTKNGAEMSIAAYLTNVEIYGVNSIKDYAFTTEPDELAESNDDTILNNVLNNNMNVDMTLANSTRNLGGNTKAGREIINEFTLIVLQQTITEKVLNVLASKVRGNSGISAIYTAIVAELNKYLTNGYLTTSKYWKDNDWVVNVNNKNYTIINQNTALPNGYYVTVLPISSLSESDISAHKCPNIYIVLADSYGIRKVEISGEVF